MSKFKIGDAVRRVGTWDLSFGLPVGEVGIVSVLHSNGLIEIKGYGDWLHITESLELVEQVDELPPAPESVQYIELTGSGRQLATLHALQHHLGDGIIVHTQGAIKLTSDEALQLCHDLTRMAMEIKRKEKQV